MRSSNGGQARGGILIPEEVGLLARRTGTHRGDRSLQIKSHWWSGRGKEWGLHRSVSQQHLCLSPNPDSLLGPPAKMGSSG